MYRHDRIFRGIGVMVVGGATLAAIGFGARIGLQQAVSYEARTVDTASKPMAAQPVPPSAPVASAKDCSLDSGAKRNEVKRSGFERPFQARQARLGMAS